MHILIRQAEQSEALLIHRLLYSPPHPNLRERSPGEIARLIEEGFLFVAEDADGNELIAASYIADEDNRFEFGGVFVRKDRRGHGLLMWLGLSCILTVLLTQEEGAEVIAHVVKGNDGPRKGLEKLGFVSGKLEQVPQASLSGLSHMDADSQGFVHATTYTLQHDVFAETVSRKLLGFSGWSKSDYIELDSELTNPDTLKAFLSVENPAGS